VTSQPDGAVYLTDAEANDVGRIFSNRLTYSKGGMVLEMLRWKLGDATFFQGVRNYLDDPALAYKYATTEDLKSHLEAASGQNLAEFFNDWVYNQGYPTYTITASHGTPGPMEITIEQQQSHPSVSFFEMPVPVRVYGSGGEQLDLTLDNTFNGQVFNVNVPFEVIGIEFDPEFHILSRNSTITLGNENFTLNRNIKLFPNPAENMLNISLPDGAVVKSATIYNVLGQTVLKSSGQTSWNISTLAPGVHFISVVTDAGVIRQKFIKK